MPILHYNITGNARGLVAATGRAGAAMNALNAKATGFGAVAKRGAVIAGKAFATVGIAAGIAGAAIAIEATKKAINFEQAFAKVRKTVNGSEAEFQRIKNELLKLSPALGMSNVELAELAAVAGQMGVPADQIVGFTEVLAKLTVATDILGEEGALNLGRFMTVMNQNGPKAAENAQHIADVLVNLGNNMAAMESEILEASTALGEYSAIAGVSVDHTLAFAAALVEAGEAPQGIASGVGRAFTEINTAVLSSSDELEGFARVAGVSADDFARAWRDDAGGAFVQFLEGLSKVEDKASVLKDLGLSDVRQIRTISLLAQNIDRVREVLGFVEDAAGAAQTEFEKFAETSAFKIQQVIESINTLLTILGNIILERYVAPLVEDLQKAATAAAEAAAAGADLDEILRAMAETGDVGAKLADGFVRAQGAIQTVIGLFKILFGAIQIIVGIIKLLTIGFALAVTGIMAGIATLIRGFGQVVKAVRYVLKAIDAITPGSMQGAIDAVDNFEQKVFDTAENIDSWNEGVWRRADQYADEAFTNIKDGAANMGSGVTTTYQGIQNLVNGMDWRVDMEADDTDVVTKAQQADAARRFYNDAEWEAFLDANPEYADTKIQNTTALANLFKTGDWKAYLDAVTEGADAKITASMALAIAWKTGDWTAFFNLWNESANAEANESIGLAEYFKTGDWRAFFFGNNTDAVNKANAATAAAQRYANPFGYVTNLVARDYATNIIYGVLNALARIPSEKTTTVRVRYVGGEARPSQFGGPRQGGELLLVGERGPELFVPNTSGRVIPNNRLGNGGGRPVGGTTVVNVTVEGSVITEAQLSDRILDNLQRQRRRTTNLGLN